MGIGTHEGKGAGAKPDAVAPPSILLLLLLLLLLS
jgi:hypothetical protein